MKTDRYRKVKNTAIAAMISSLSVFGTTISAQDNSSGFTFNLNTEIANQVLSEVCSNIKIDEDAIRSSKPIKGMITHFAQFRDYFTMEAYVEGRQKAANCEIAEKDPYRFNQVIHEKDKIKGQLADLLNKKKAYSAGVSKMLMPYTPDTVSFSGSAYVMIGTPSCGGWAKGQDFYVDFPCINGDEQGMQYLIAHELYHGVQHVMMPPKPTGDEMALLFDQIIREGSATAIADMSKIKNGGDYTKLSQRILKVNDRRKQQNFDLLEMAIAYMKAGDQQTHYAQVNSIGLSGAFDSPFYNVGTVVFQVVEKSVGTKAIVQMLQTNPMQIFVTYIELQKDDNKLPKLGKITSEVILRDYQK